MRHIEIQAVLNGYIVNVGCQQVVFETREKLVAELTRYMTSSKDVEKEYIEKATNGFTMTEPITPPEKYRAERAVSNPVYNNPPTTLADVFTGSPSDQVNSPR